MVELHSQIAETGGQFWKQASTAYDVWGVGLN